MWPVIDSSALIGGKFIHKKNPLQDLLSSLNAVISTNESTWIITGHVIYNPAYTYKLQLKTPTYWLQRSETRLLWTEHWFSWDWKHFAKECDTSTACTQEEDNFGGLQGTDWHMV